MRTQIIAELASNHGGNLSLAQDMIKAAADAGADFCKLQLYNAALLNDDDPQKAWLTKAQVDRPFLEACMETAFESGVTLTASVFGPAEAQMAYAAGLGTVKIGSGDSARWRLVKECALRFRAVWVSCGLKWFTRTLDCEHALFYGVSQYPTPYMRGLAALMQRPSGLPFSWSDHGADLEVAKEAILHGATYLERHFSHGKEARWSKWDSDQAGLRELRDHAEACAWEGTDAHKAACAAYLGRWGR